MVRCSTCNRDVDDIRPQIEGVGTCFACSGKPMTREALDRWIKIEADKKRDIKKTAKKVWVTGLGIYDGDRKETMFTVTLYDIPLTLVTFPDLRQSQMTIARDEILLLRDAIDKMLTVESGSGTAKD
ncbi:hypothetical protein GQ472_01555 [archaeon]|nr:hypothetical protein [archaeon]